MASERLGNGTIKVSFNFFRNTTKRSEAKNWNQLSGLNDLFFLQIWGIFWTDVSEKTSENDDLHSVFWQKLQRVQKVQNASLSSVKLFHGGKRKMWRVGSTINHSVLIWECSPYLQCNNRCRGVWFPNTTQSYAFPLAGLPRNSLLSQKLTFIGKNCFWSQTKDLQVRVVEMSVRRSLLCFIRAR